LFGQSRLGDGGGHKLIKHLTYILYNIHHILISPILRILIIFSNALYFIYHKTYLFGDDDDDTSNASLVVSISFDKTLYVAHE